MPIRSKKFAHSAFDYVCVALFSFFAFCVSLYNHSGILNAIIFAVLMGILVWFVTLLLQHRASRKLCTVYAKATVITVAERLTSGPCILTLQYSVFGQPVTSRVTYSEKRRPNPGELVGVYYNEAHPTACMLKMYRGHNPGWTDLTRRVLRNGIVALFILGGIFYILGILVGVVSKDMRAKFDSSATGYVSDYSEQRNSGVNVTVEYTPIVTYEYEGIEYTASATNSSYTKNYEIGEEVSVRFSKDTPTYVFIKGDNATSEYSCVTTIAGSLLLALGVVRALQYKKICADIESCRESIPFL